MMCGRERLMATITEKKDKRSRGLSVSLVPGADEPALRSLIGKSVAVSSGKGGVGKTITACNLAIYYARRGLRVGLVDVDPLSDVATLLDLQESEQALEGGKVKGMTAWRPTSSRSSRAWRWSSRSRSWSGRRSAVSWSGSTAVISKRSINATTS